MTENYFTQENVREMARAIGALLGEACNARDQAEMAMKWRDALEKIAYKQARNGYLEAYLDMIAIASDALGLDGRD